MNRQEVLTTLLLDDTFKEWVLSQEEEHGRYWNAWKLQHPERVELLHEARDILLQLQEDKVPLGEDRKAVLRNRIIRIAQSEQLIADHHSHPSLQSRRIWVGLRVAAALGGLLALGALLYPWVGTSSQEMEFATTYGEIKTITLPDSSQVTLNGNSSIRYRYDKQQTTELREVWLMGEAFFEVRKRMLPAEEGRQQAVKFIVHTENLSVRVLGTRFNVRHRRDQTQVVLEEGSVQLQLPEQHRSLFMSPDEMVEVQKGEPKISQQAVKVGEYTGWKEGLIHLQGASFPEINRILEDNYNLTLHFEQQELMTELNLRGAFPASHIDILLEAIANVTQTSIRKEGNRIIYQ